MPDYARARYSLHCDARSDNKLAGAVASAVTADEDLAAPQARLNLVREVFSRKTFPSMIAAIKQSIAIYSKDPEWARVRPPLVELTAEQAKSLGAELTRIGFAMTGIGNRES